MKLLSQIFIAILLLFSCVAQKEEATQIDYTQFVNPFIGAAENGHCFPNACVPFGLIQVGAETGNCEWRYCSGYQSSDSIINGFSQTRLNGTGCPDLGDLLMLPFTGEAMRESYTSQIDKKTESASPGYYSTTLTDFNIDAEMTASEHVAFHSYSYPKGGPAHLLIDFQSATVGNKPALHKHVLDAEVNFESPTVITGFSNTDVWLERTYYYVIEFSHPVVSKIELPKLDEREVAPRYVFDFDIPQGEKLMIKVGLSSTSIEGAKENLLAEVAHWDFEKVRHDGKNKWNQYLSQIKVEGDADKKEMFYTSMYRLFIQPNNIADVGKEPFYSTLSLWDTYRAAHPLYTIVSPEKVDAFVNSMLHQYDDQGFLPIWALWGKETYCMIGNHAVPVIVDAYLKGFKGFDAERAYKAIKTTLTTNMPKSNWEVYDKYGYYPFDIVTQESVSRTLESTYDDYCAAQFAKALGKEDDYEFFSKRSNYYKNLFDPESKLMRGKDSDGKWRTPFHRFSLSHAETSGGDYTEGNAWQYTWHVQHDVEGLIELMGSEDYFTSKLDSLFTMAESQEGSGFVSDVTGLIGQYAHGNEPSHHVAYLYALADKPYRTQELLNEIVKTKYINEINGLCGNDDCGQMSAWYIFTNLGFYPLNPCGGEYILGAPQLEKASVNLPSGKTFIVEAANFSENNIYVKSVTLNGKKYEKKYIAHQDLMKGGKLVFEMTDRPL
ncbi:GH92 family glycosyl hydrolase [Sunxiuqinia sp. A32]|uniref:GH92 family glycosyl hydrolase n=1 Tax=Sunxiuqinia sp. A32 TaxID=3461496 RepID=UPI004045C9CA